jgi:transaldolase
VYSTAQGILAAKAGASVVTVAIDALEAVGQDGTRIVADLRQAFDRSTTECDVAAAGPSGASAFAACAVAGADVSIVKTETLRALLQHPLTDRGLDRFLGDISRRPKPRRAR